MALLSDFFITKLDEIALIDGNRSPSKSFPSVEARSVEVVKLVQLQCILDGSAFEDHLRELNTLIVRSMSDDGPWIVTVPNVVIDALAEADENKISQYGMAWAATDEWKRDGGTPSNVVALTKDIASLAQKAKLAGQAMFVWVSL